MSVLNDISNFVKGVTYDYKTLGVNRSKQSDVSVYDYTYAYDVARKPNSVSQLRSEVLKSPEILSRVLTLIDDILPDYEVVCEDEKLKKRVEQDLKKMNFFRELHSAYLDFLITGDGYLEPVYVRESQIDTLLNSITNLDLYKDYFTGTTTEVEHLKKEMIKQNPTLYEPKEIFWVRSDEMFKEYDIKGRITGYKQILYGQETAKWDPAGIINLSAYKAQSEIYGFTPLMSYLDDLVTLTDTKLFIGNFFKNNGTPDYIIGLEDSTGPNDPAFKKLQEMMKKRREERMRGTLVASGKLFVQAINQTKDMDFDRLLGYLNDNLDLIWRIPPQKLRGTSSKTRDANAVLRPYYNRIKKEQRMIEDYLNINFFAQFGSKEGQVTIKLSNASSVDQVVDSAWISTAWNDGTIGLTEYRSRLGLPAQAPNDLDDNPNYQTKEEKEQMMQEMNAQKQPNPNGGATQNNQANPMKTPKQEANGK